MKNKYVSYLAVTLVGAEFLLILASWLLSATMTEGVRSLLSAEGIRWFLGQFTTTLQTPLLVHMLLLAVSVGSLWKCNILRCHVTEYRERLGLYVALFLLIIYIGAVLVLTAIPHAVLLSPTGRLFPSPFSHSLVSVISFGLLLLAIGYGVVAGEFKTHLQVLESLSFGIEKFAPAFLLYILLIQFYYSFSFVFL